MNLKPVTLLFITLVSFIHGQELKYWQQEVNYKISVTLDDENHFLKGNETITYINNSPNTLHEIYMHLWPNAYKNGATALAQQLYEEGNDILQNVTTANQGYIDSLDFEIDGELVKWTFDPKHIDIARLQLNAPLLPGEKIRISTPFRVKIPSGSISRLGHIDQSYQITQWYPKPAVYDANGWNQMPYLNQGEFYSEFGSFDVSITLPENYVVGSTGDLQTQKEIDFLKEKVKETEEKISNLKGSKKINKEKTPFPESSEKTKTLRYVQENIHDFAWFADKRYDVLKGEVELPNTKKKVTTWAMFVPQNIHLWKDAIEYLNDGAYYYSKWNGDYPYNQITAVDGTISAGGGMEYPNVTVIGNSSTKEELEIVIVHEVGHNWFYGILGTNERVHGWMDEGLNTLNEVRYIQTKYPENTRLADMILNGGFNFHGLDYHDMNDLLVRTFEWFAVDQPIETHSAEFTQLNYGLTMYQKTGLVFEYLKAYLGDSLFDAGMHKYYEKWKFKHPQPEDLQKVLEEVSGESLDWLFEDLIKTTRKLDFKIGCTRHKHGKTEVKIKNKGQVDAPVFVTASNDERKEQRIIRPFDKKEKLIFDFEADSVIIDAERKIPEINRQNNLWHKNQFINRVEPIKIKPLLSYNRANETNINWFPALGTNASDRFMLGVGLHNFSPAFNPFNYMIIPMYSFGQNSLSGLAEFSYSVKPKNRIKELKYGLSVKSFGTERFPGQNEKYVAFAPFTRFYFRDEKKRNPFKHIIHFQGHFNNTLRTGSNRIEQGGFGYYKTYYESRDHEFEFVARQSYIQDVGASEDMARITAESTYRFRYFKKHSKWIEMRFFAGALNLFNVNEGSANAYRYSLSPSGTNGIQDVFVEEYFFNRNAITGFFGNQRMENQGGFKSNSIFGLTDSWLTTVNMFMDLPISISGIGIFADAGLVNTGGETSFMYNTGIGIRASKLIAIYFPLLTSENLLSGLPSEAYYNRIRFTINMNFVNSDKIRRLID